MSAKRLLELRVVAARAAKPAAPPRPVAMMQARAAAVAAGAVTGDGVPGAEEKVWEDVRRICALPVEGSLTPEEVEAFSREFSLRAAFDKGFRLWEAQARAIDSYQRVGGLLAPIPVGGGKTLTALSIAHHAYAKGIRSILVMLPAETITSFHKQVPWIRAHVPLEVPLHKVEGDSARRGRLAASQMPGCYAMPYSLLSTDDAEDLLFGIAPELIVCDEVHKLKYRDSGRTRRVERYLDESRKKHRIVRFVGMSGTITSRSLRDYWHLLTWALAERAPAPMSYYAAMNLAAVIDSDADPSTQQVDDWQPLRTWAGVWFPDEDLPPNVEGVRRAYRCRLNSAPGVVSSGDEPLDTVLILRNTTLPTEDDPGAALMLNKLEDVMDYLIAPNGEDIDHAIHCHKWARELTVGFYNEQVWPTAEELAKVRDLDVEDANTLLERAKTHHEMKCVYKGELRRWFAAHNLSGLDTPRQVGVEMRQHGHKRVGKALYEVWKAAKDLEFADMPERYARPVRVCDYKIQAAVRWAIENQCGVIWYYHIEIGAWLAEAMRDAGVEALHYPAGMDPVEFSDGHAKIKAAKQRVHLMSMAAHGTGKNLQHHDRQLFVEWPRSSNLAQQVLGRLHRPGQVIETLYADTLDSTNYDRQMRTAGLIDSLYHSQTVGVPQRVVFCGYEPLPRYFPPSVLRERGFQNKELSEYQKLLLQERTTVDDPTGAQ